MTERVLEGTWEEIVRQAKQFTGRKVRLFVLEDQERPTPNQRALAVLQRVRDRQKKMHVTSGEKAVDIVRRGRAGEMFDDDPR